MADRSVENRWYLKMAWYERCQLLVAAVTCLDVYADIALQLHEQERAVWCIGAVDGVLATTGQSRTELVGGEHQRRLDLSRSLMAAGNWQRQYERGRANILEEIFAELHTWCPDEPCPRDKGKARVRYSDR